MSEETTNNEDVLMTPAERLRRTCTACKLTQHRWGTSKSFSSNQKERVAEFLGATKKRLSAGKRLINTKNAHYTKVVAVLAKVKAEWTDRTLPYVEDGVRLMRNQDIQLFQDYVQNCQAELNDAVNELREHWKEVVDEAREELGQLFNPKDYEEDVGARYAIEVEYPSVEPPSYLRDISPDIYREQSERVAARFNEAVLRAEEMFAEELHELVSTLADRLSPDEKGQRKVFRDTAINNVREFASKFRRLNISGNEQLESLVAEVEGILTTQTPRGPVPVTAAELRGVDWIRQQTQERMAEVATRMASMAVSRPRRKMSGNAAESIEVEDTEGVTV